MSLMQYAICDLLDYEPTLDSLASRQAYVRRALTAYGYEVCDGGASFYVYVKSPVPDDFRFTELLASMGVLVVPSTLFHDPGYVRLSLTARVDAIASSLTRLLLVSSLHVSEVPPSVASTMPATGRATTMSRPVTGLRSRRECPERTQAMISRAASVTQPRMSATNPARDAAMIA